MLKPIHRHLLRFLGGICCLALFAALAITACDDAKGVKKVRLKQKDNDGSVVVGERKEETIKFGFDLRLSPKEDVRLYVPFLEYLSQRTGLEFTIVFSPNYEETMRNLGTGITQFASLGSVNCLRANQLYHTQCLVAGKNLAGEPVYQAAIVTAADSPIRTLRDLRGRSVAFGSRFSTQGYLIPRAMIEEAGIVLEDLGHYRFTGSHDEVARAVLNGEYDVGAMQDTLARELARQGKVRIVAMSRNYPASLICANSQVAPELVEKVRRALLEFDPAGIADSRLTENWSRSEMPTGFAPYQDQAFAEIERLAKRYGLLP